MTEHSIRKHGKGAIVRIKVENFLTYANVEVHPNPGLNVIIGPNGNGKSSLVNAIGLGLGGEPSIIGRSKDIVDYIKEGAEPREAYILIELCVPNGRNCIVERTISEVKNTFKINGQQKSRAEVSRYMKEEFRIQVDNMCQYLPQDKVSEFAKMNQQDLLRSTQGAVGSLEMVENYIELIETSKSIINIDTVFKNDQKHMENEEVVCKELEKAVQAHADRVKVQDAVAIRKKKMPWIKVRVANACYKEKKEEAKVAEIQLKKEQIKTRPLEQMRAEIKAEQKIITQEFVPTTRKLRGKQAEMIQSIEKLDELDSKIADIGVEVAYTEQKVKDWKKMHDDTQKLIDGNQQQLEGLTQTEFDNKPRIDEINAHIQETSNQIAEKDAVIYSIEQGSQETDNEMRSLKNELNRLGDAETKKQEKMKREDMVTYKAYMWLQSNRDRFKHPVYGPIGYEIEIKDQAHTKYVENAIGPKDRNMFVCDNYDDYNLFQREVRDKSGLGLPANFAVVLDKASSYAPDISLVQIRQFGFYMFLGDMFECNDLVRSYLNSSIKAHAVPVGTKETDSQVMLNAISDVNAITTFYTDNRRYKNSISLYGSKQKSSRSNELMQPRFFTKVDKSNEARVTICRNKLQELQELKASNDEQIGNLRLEKEELQKKNVDLGVEMAELMGPARRIRDIRINLNRNQKKLDDLKATKLDMGDVRKKADADINKVLVTKVSTVEDLCSFIKACANLYEQRVYSSLRHSAITRKIEKIDVQIQAISADKERYEIAFREAENDAKEMKDRVMRYKNEACRVCGLPPNSALPNLYLELFRDLPEVEDELQAEIVKYETELECTMATDEGVIKEFETRSNNLQEFRKKVIENGGRLETLKRRQGELREAWLTPLEDLVDRINVRFKDLFQKMKCAGEISISKGENEDDFEKYGIAINVSFRDTDQLQVLTPWRQSGGERSVTTVLYIMALQELSKVPFRCVDEINQGMDMHNERRVFDLVVSTASQENTSQYFLLTPKLLPDMDFGRHAKVMCVYRLPFCSFSSSEFNINRICKVARRKIKLNRLTTSCAD